MTTQLPAPDAPGAVPPGYTLGRLLGRGGSGTVHEARQHSTGRAVALKVLDIDVVGPEMQRRFGRERAAMSGLAGHPHIVSIVDAGSQAGRPWLAMDLCSGGSLADTAAPMTVAHALELLRAIGSALAAAHAQNVLHCDVKPGNILLTAYGQPALSDFGIARITLESQGSRIGGYTLDHVPPEILAGAHPTGRGDVWSLGTTVWQLLEGRPPFRDGDDIAAASVMRRIGSDPLPRMRRRDVPDELTGLLERMTAKDPQRRPSAEEVSRRAADLARAGGHPVGAPLPLPSRRPASTSGSPSIPPIVPAPSISGPPTPRAPHPHDLDAATGRIPMARAASPAAPTPTAQGGGAPATPSPPRRRRWGLIASGLVVLVLAAMVGGGVLTYRLVPARTVTAPPTTVTVTAAPAPAASPAAVPSPAAPAAPSGLPPLYLGQVEEVSATGSLTKQGYGINGTFYPLSINVGTYSSSQPAGIEYLLNRQYRTLSTAFGVADTYSNLGQSDATPPSCTLQVLLDGRPLGAPRTATRQSPVQIDGLDVRGGLRLSFVISQSGATGSSSSSGNSTEYPCTLGNPVAAN